MSVGWKWAFEGQTTTLNRPNKNKGNFNEPQIVRPSGYMREQGAYARNVRQPEVSCLNVSSQGLQPEESWPEANQLAIYKCTEKLK